MDKQVARICGNCARFARVFKYPNGKLKEIFENEPDAGYCVNDNHVAHQKVYKHFKCSNNGYTSKERG